MSHGNTQLVDLHHAALWERSLGESTGTPTGSSTTLSGSASNSKKIVQWEKLEGANRVKR